MIWFLVRLYRYGLPTSRRWEFKWDGAVSLAALLGCTGLLLHSFVDFNLQIPANAALFYVLCGLAASPLTRLSNGRSLELAGMQKTEDVALRPTMATRWRGRYNRNTHPREGEPRIRSPNV